MYDRYATPAAAPGAAGWNLLSTSRTACLAASVTLRFRPCAGLAAAAVVWLGLLLGGAGAGAEAGAGAAAALPPPVPTCCWVRRATRYCSAASHLISSSSLGAQTRYVRLGVMILNAWAFESGDCAWGEVDEGDRSGEVVPPPACEGGEDDAPAAEDEPEALGLGGASYSIASRIEASGIWRLNLLSCVRGGGSLHVSSLRHRSRRARARAERESARDAPCASAST